MQQTDIFLKSPDKKGRASFSIIERTGLKNRTIKNERTEALNADYKAGKIEFNDAKNQFKDIIQQLKPKIAVLHFQGNERVLEAYWEAEYSNRDISAPDKAKNRLSRAIRAVGHYSLRSASREELQSAVDQSLDRNAQRTAVSALNQLLKFIKRDFKLRKLREEMKSIRYLTETEFEKVLSFVTDPGMKLLARVAFATGGRVGELFAIRPEDLSKTHLLIDSQIDEKGIRRETKNRRIRRANIIPAYYKYVQEWSLIPAESRLAIRVLIHSKIIKRASLKALNRPYVFHDLRHSYATYLRGKGVSITLLAACLGNSVAVCDKYYAARGSSEELQLVDNLLRSS